MEPILVTGGTGNLGRDVVRRLTADGHTVHVLSRRAPAQGTRQGHRTIVGDLKTGAGLPAAVEGARTVIHCATSSGQGDIRAARNLVAAARGGGLDPHLVFVSIVGVDTIPIRYYRAKLTVERLIADSGLPWTVQRATQFHTLVAGFFDAQRRLPLTLALARCGFQPIDTGEVADHLVRLAQDAPAGRVADIGGPRVHAMDDLARLHNRLHGRSRRVFSLRLPGRMARAFATGANLVPENPTGSITFEDFLTERLGGDAR
ncbi:SDR family oxidoreductase [Streptomyces profundus]|uniref:SDR family oxidoreductase n=1 Tax=Streptomyces profundus TaxID=2867410 RepID=UPI001D167560|nr:NAD(P)H-binding protein [Streptomyces sp. MA3_2.13]UED83291.1 NAD(P)H-binding protein [Streptomyces sp. MA3_2.13]